MDMTLVDLLAKIPESAWGVIGGALGVIGGALITPIAVVIGNNHSRKLQAQQHEFERRERQQERRANLCRDVYLPAANAVVEMTTKFGKLVDGSLASFQEAASGTQALGAATIRVQMVGSAETVNYAAGFHRASLQAFFRLQQFSYPMILRNIDIGIVDSMRQRHHDERMKYIELMKEYNIAGGGDPHRFHRIQQQTDFASKQWDEANSEWLQLSLAQEVARLDMIENCIQILTELSKSHVPLLAAIRSELEAADGSSAALIEKEAHKTADVGTQALIGVIPTIKENIARLRADIEADEQRKREEAAV